jgi:hypothetical protein
MQYDWKEARCKVWPKKERGQYFLHVTLASAAKNAETRQWRHASMFSLPLCKVRPQEIMQDTSQSLILERQRCRRQTDRSPAVAMGTSRHTTKTSREHTVESTGRRHDSRAAYPLIRLGRRLVAAVAVATNRATGGRRLRSSLLGGGLGGSLRRARLAGGAVVGTASCEAFPGRNETTKST